MCSNSCCTVQLSPALAVCLMLHISRSKTMPLALKTFGRKQLQQSLKWLLLHHWQSCRTGKGKRWEKGVLYPQNGLTGSQSLQLSQSAARSCAGTDNVQISVDAGEWALFILVSLYRQNNVLHTKMHTAFWESQRSRGFYPTEHVMERLSPDTRMMRSFACASRRLWKYRIIAGMSFT